MLRKGEVRYNWTANQVTTPAYTLSKFTFTGQYSYMDDPSTSGVTEGFGLMFYNARWYDPALGRFAQADSIIPPGVQGLDRYAYVNNSPLNYVDPSGHEPKNGEGACYELGCKNANGTTPSLGNGRGGRSGGDDGNDANGNGVSDKPVPGWEYQHPSNICQYNNLTECFYSGAYWPEGDYTFSEDEWETFMYALYLNISEIASSGDGFWTREFDPTGIYGKSPYFVPYHTESYYTRLVYDTPFWDNADSGNVLTGNICIPNGHCANRNDVNYIAQGMWSAAGNETKIGAVVAAILWKSQYEGNPSPDVYYFAVYGANKYYQLNAMPPYARP